MYVIIKVVGHHLAQVEGANPRPTTPNRGMLSTLLLHWLSLRATETLPGHAYPTYHQAVLSRAHSSPDSSQAI